MSGKSHLSDVLGRWVRSNYSYASNFDIKGNQMMRKIFFSCLVAALIFGSVISYGQSGEKDKYQKWLNEDIADIIEPAEKKVFLKLKTDEERDQFIEAFWRRRDPNPDTEENEYRDEHYKRIAYANKNFAFENVSGSRTDRGRIYIRFGEPDEKQKTQTGEIWKYKYIPSLGKGEEIEFFDVSGTGNLRLRAHP
jgi:GWxTD domain-containing protein